MVSHYKKLAGEKCFLSPCAPQDAAKWAEWLNDLEVAIPLGDEAYATLALDKVEEDLRGAMLRGDPIFTICDLVEETPIGRCLLFGVDQVNRSANLGIFIGDQRFWNQGYGQDALRLLLHFGFDLLNLHSIMLGVFAFNQRAIQAYRKVGFQEIGRRREARIIAGKKYDVVLMDILEGEFRQRYGMPGFAPG